MLDVMIKSVVRLYHFTPTDISKMYVDTVDYNGLEYWYNDAKDYNEEIKKGSKK